MQDTCNKWLRKQLKWAFDLILSARVKCDDWLVSEEGVPELEDHYFATMIIEPGTDKTQWKLQWEGSFDEYHDICIIRKCLPMDCLLAAKVGRKKQSSCNGGFGQHHDQVITMNLSKENREGPWPRMCNFNLITRKPQTNLKWGTFYF